MTDVEFESLLDNWIEWSRRRAGLSAVESLEGKYRSPQSWHPVTPRSPINVLDAQMVEDAWKAMPSIMHKLLLKWWFVFLRSPSAIRKSLRQHGLDIRTDLDTEVARAKRMLHRQLDNENKTDETARHNSGAADAYRSIQPEAGLRAPA